MNRTYRLVTDIDGFRSLKDEWNELLAQSQAGTPFLTWEWMFTWWQHYTQGKNDRRLAIVVARKGDHAAEAILPGYVRRSFGFSTYAFLGTEFESTDYLRAIGTEDASVLQGMVQFLREAARPLDVLELSNILSSDRTLGVLEMCARETGASFESQFHRVCPFIDVAGIGSWDQFLASRSSNIRRKVCRSARRLTESGVEFDWVRERSQVESAVDEVFKLHARRFAVKEAESLFRADLRQPFHQDVSELFFDRDMLRLFRLRSNGQTIAAMYCFEFESGLFYFQGGIDPEWEEHSVGMVTMLHAIRYAFDQRLRLFDFMRGGEPYKFRWTSTVRDMVVARLGTSAKGRAALALQRHGGAIKKAVKKIVRPTRAPRAQVATS